MRLSGMLLPISALPSNYGIGCFSKEAYEFVDTLKKCGQSLWQILPLGPTGYGDSPYQSFSTFAGNPYFIDLETLVKDGLLGRLECEGADFGTGNTIDYEKMFHTRYRILHMAYQRAVTNGITETDDYHSFVKKNESWLPDYALFMALKDANHGKSWSEWEEGIRNRRPEALEEAGQKYKTDIGFYEFVQYEFFRQWDALKKYANEQGIQIIGDIPIYVAFDSADTWSDTKQFQLDEDNLPVAVAGCPPDSFGEIRSMTGSIIRKPGMHGGCGVSHIALRCMISSESIISGALMNIMQFLTERKQQETENGSKVREWICLVRSESSLAICRSLQKISAF